MYATRSLFVKIFLPVDPSLEGAGWARGGRGTNKEGVCGPDQTSEVCFASFKGPELISTFTKLSVIGGFKFDNGPKLGVCIKLLEH